MLLFKGYMGTILHTGDFRFTQSMLKDYSELYPLEKQNENNTKCSV